MSVLARRSNDDEFHRERALIAIRDAVVDATTDYMPSAGSSATLEAVDEALAQLVATRRHLGETEVVKALWITYARRRLIDEHRSADFKYRDAIAVDEHAQALAVTAPGDVGEPTEGRRELWRVREILSVLHGEQRKWAHAWYLEVLSGSLPAGAQPRGLPEILGWSSAKTEKTSQRARRKMAAFVTQRQSGDVCTEQRALLDALITASGPNRGHSEALNEERYEAVVFHVAGCDDCWALWHAHRRSLLARCHSILLIPLDALSAAGHALADRVAAAAVGAHSATQALLARIGLGGAGAAALGSSSAATISTKTAAVCVTVVCAATAGGEIAGVLPALHERTPKIQDATAAKPKKATTPAQTQTSVLRNTAPTTPSPVRSAATLAASRTGPQAHTATIQAPVTPGDLPVARAARSPSKLTRSSAASPTGLSTLSAPSASNTSPTRRRATSTAPRDEPDCVPGDLGC